MKRLLATLLLLTLVVALPRPSVAGIDEGLEAYARGDYATALRQLRPLAEQGYAAAQSELGVMYNNGQGVPRDDAKAFKWFSKAAEQGNAGGQYNLGVMYNNGQGVQQSYAEAFTWFRKAAEQGYVIGQYRLGVMYDNGLGVTQDYAEAVKWFRYSAENGFAKAQYALGGRYAQGQGVKQDDAEAAKWFHKSAEQGDTVAQVALGIMYDIGRGVPEDDGKAVKWYRKAAEQGLASAQFKLGIKYGLGKGIPQDYVLAHMWHNLAAAKGDKDAPKLRDIVAKSMTAVQIAKAQHLAREWTADFEKKSGSSKITEKKPAPSKPYEGNAPTAPTAAYAGSSDSDFRAIKLGDNFAPIINGYENNGKIPAAPGVRVDAFLKSYLGGSITNAVGMYQGVAILKMQNALQDSKAKCQHGIVIMVEALQKAGIRGWENYWRKDYDVPVYNVKFHDIYAKVTCRGNRSGWFLEYLQALRGEKLKKLLR